MLTFWIVAAVLGWAAWGWTYERWRRSLKGWEYSQSQWQASLQTNQLLLVQLRQSEQYELALKDQERVKRMEEGRRN